MALHLHRAERTDLLADGLGALLADPLPDPFAEELVLVPARGVERWLSQRLSHVLGCAHGSRDGVCAGVAFRSPGSLIAEITGTADDDPWSPEAMTWPLLDVIDCSLDEPWCATLAKHLGHFDINADEAELRKGRRYAVARRLAGLFASYARQRPQLLVDWLEGNAGRPRRRPGLATRTVAGAGRRRPRRSPAHPSPEDRRPAARRPEPTCHRGCRCSGTPGWRAPTSSCSTRCPPTTTCTCGCRTPATSCGRRSPATHGAIPRRDDTSHREVGHPLLATLGRDLRELQRGLPTDLQTDEYLPGATSAPTRCSAGCSPTSPPMWFGHKGARSRPMTAPCRYTAATARPARSMCCARCCSACCRTTRRWSRATSW